MSEQKYHHRIPKTYLKAWGESVWYYDKQTGKSEKRNIETIMGQSYFHSIKAGSTFQTPKSLSKIFAPLSGLSIQYNNIPLSTPVLQNQYWYEYDNWEISNNGKVISRKQRNVLKTMISQINDNTIEDLWSSKYESGWAETISHVEQVIKEFCNGKKSTLTRDEYEELLRYYVMYLWRSSDGYEEAAKAFDWIMSLFPEGGNIPLEQPVRPGDKTIKDELWHEYLLSEYQKFLRGAGTMQAQFEAYGKNLTLVVRIDMEERLITSDNPCFEYTREDEIKEPIFVALPSLLITLAKKDPDEPNAYRIIQMGSKDVDHYNKLVFENGNQIISRTDLKDDQAFEDII